MTYPGRNASIIMAALALVVTHPDPSSFQGLAFGVTSYKEDLNPKVRGKHKKIRLQAVPKCKKQQFCGCVTATKL